MADATYKVIGLSKKKGKPAESSESDYQIQCSPRGEKEKNPDKPKNDEYYDDRLSRDSQLDSHLKELVSDAHVSGELGGFVTGAYDDQEAGDQEVTDEFYDETDGTNEMTDQPAGISLAGDIYTPAAIEEMLGDWGAEQLSPPQQHMPPPAMAATAGQSARSVSSELLINISDRHEGEKSAQETGRKTPVEVRMAAQITFMQEQLDAALSQVTILEQKVNSQRDFVLTQVAWNTSMSEEAEQISKRLAEETGQLNSRIIATDAKAEAAHTAAKLADNRAKQATEVAAKSLQASVSHQKRLKELEANMAQISNTQETLHQQLTQQADKGAPSPLTAPMADTYENSIFFGGIPAFRDRLGLSPHSDPIFVMSRLLRDMGIYAGMDSIVLADNAAKSRLEVGAAIIHMRSSFHKRAAMVILRRELASQRLPGTTVRDCFPTIMMARVKRLNRLGMELKTAGKIVKFQVINRKGQPVLQIGLKNQNYADYQGTIGDEDEAENNGEWFLVENRRKRPHPENTLTSPNSRPLAADRQVNNQPPPTAATWAALTEQEFPELPSQTKSAETAKSAAKPAAAQKEAQPGPVDQQKKKQPGGGPVESRGPQKQHSRGPVEFPRGGPQQQPSRGPAETPRGSQPGSYPASRAGSQQNSRPSTPPPIRSIFDDDRDLRNSRKQLPQRQFSSKFAQHLLHSRDEY
jgi:chemotaxis protein histidine kinase CheA